MLRKSGRQRGNSKPLLLRIPGERVHRRRQPWVACTGWIADAVMLRSPALPARVVDVAYVAVAANQKGPGI